MKENTCIPYFPYTNLYEILYVPTIENVYAFVKNSSSQYSSIIVSAKRKLAAVIKAQSQFFFSILADVILGTN